MELNMINVAGDALAEMAILWIAAEFAKSGAP